MRAILTAALLLAATPALAQQITGTGTVTNTGLRFADLSDGSRVFLSQSPSGGGFKFTGRIVAPDAYIGRLQRQDESVDHPAFYRVDLGMIVILDVGMICTNVSTPQTSCQ